MAATLAPMVASGAWTEAQLTQLLKDAVQNNPEVSAMTVAFEPCACKPTLRYFALHAYRQGDSIKKVAPDGGEMVAAQMQLVAKYGH